jgi:xanthine dehydrogenase accessory factor
MAIAANGTVVGSVSGGCIEDDLVHRYAWVDDHLRPGGAPLLVRYGVTADEAHRFGLPCGGTIELLLEFDPSAEALARLLALLQNGHLVERSVTLADGAVALTPVTHPRHVPFDNAVLVNTFGPTYRLLLIGAGQLAGYLATMALFNGFAVTVCDPREEHRTAWAVPGAALVSDMPDDFVLRFKPDRRTALVTLSHDPKLDDMALIEALRCDAFYVGAIGSRRNSLARHQRLHAHFDLSDTELGRLHAPVGLHIGSKTPAEIAVSVMAEIIAVKNGVPLSPAVDMAQAKPLPDLALPLTTACGT